MEPVTSAPVASGPMKMPSSVASWTTKLMTLVPGPLRWTPCITPCWGAGFVTSKPQNHVYAPVTKRMFVTVARSPGYWRTTIGASGVPISVLAKPLGSAAFVYIPPRNQIVLPGVTSAGPARAVAKSHGSVNDPSPDGEPVGDTKKSGARRAAARLALMPRVPGASLVATESCSAQEANSGRSATARGTTPGPERDRMCPVCEGISSVSGVQLPDPSLDVWWPNLAGVCNSVPGQDLLSGANPPTTLRRYRLKREPPVLCVPQGAARRPRGPPASGVPSFWRQASILVDADVVGRAPGPEEASEIERPHRPMLSTTLPI